ncbi:hypothetical protein VPH35_062888 [Triticum aestivum]
MRPERRRREREKERGTSSSPGEEPPRRSRPLDSVLEIQNQAKQQLQRAAMVVAAAHAEVLPLSKGKKDPSCPETSPVLPATAIADWSCLPYDLVRRIAESFLTTNDVDWYMDLRAVCHDWRSATDDPRNNTSDCRFRPRGWIILDEAFESDTRRLLLNTATGRLIHKELVPLSDYYVVATTLEGFFILADKSPPHAARIFSPLTGAMIHFKAPMPPDGEVTAAVCFIMDLPILNLFCGSSHKHYMAYTESESFFARDYEDAIYSFLQRVIKGGFDGGWTESTMLDELVRKMGNLMMLLRVDPHKFFSDDLPVTEHENNVRCFLVEFGGQVLIIIKRQLLTMVCKFEANSDKLVPLMSISNHAIFIGHQRCLVVDADNFPGIEANCIYYIEHLGSSSHICMRNLQDQKAERISKAVDFVKQDKQFVLVADRPFTIIQLLSSYTINIRDSELALQQQIT